MSFVNRYVAEILKLQVSLYHARARLESDTDPEALHDLRISVRRIRSLLAPVRNVEGMAPLRIAAAEVGRLTTPVRDLEVMIHELTERGMDAEANRRRSKLRPGYEAALVSSEMKALFTQLDAWPPALRSSSLANTRGGFEQRIRRALTKQVDRLHFALNDPDFDRHELRILVKRTRYLTESFATVSPLSKKAASSLKSVQSALGSWHDHHQWCLKADIETDLKPLALEWEEASIKALDAAESKLQVLSTLLPKVSTKQQDARQPVTA
ncbi:CHAD domain-containing protein [Pseudomonas asturiensis]|uniref:CHAD domain-containing protein n=1 Tax=Pseudomonas asturiensis TaxID=1190415 RepID=A0A1M7JYQ3_9PSED|nr:CHAD domain-containing protein [Pseudomonas asturiensis]SHM58085.1 CHAD domain-containing protein [Pseudomonas asturiensis]